MPGRNFSVAEEDRGGVAVNINLKTQRRVGVRKRTDTCWQLRRWDAEKKAYESLGYYKSQQAAEAAAAEQAAPRTPRTTQVKGAPPCLSPPCPHRTHRPALRPARPG